MSARPKTERITHVDSGPAFNRVKVVPPAPARRKWHASEEMVEVTEQADGLAAAFYLFESNSEPFAKINFAVEVGWFL